MRIDPNYKLQLLQSAPAVIARATFSADYPGFAGHFPGNPVLPGFMHIQVAMDTLAAAGVTASLAAVIAARFSRIIAPGDADITLTPAGPNQYTAEVTQAGQPASRFDLRLTQETPPV